MTKKAKLKAVILAHRKAARAFTDAVLDGRGGEDEAFTLEAHAMMELLSFPPRTIKEARERSLYLVQTRYYDFLDDEGRAFLRSFTKFR